MGVYTLSLLLLLLGGEVSGLYAREASPKNHATQCSETTETLFWQTARGPSMTSDVDDPGIPVTVTRACRDRSLLKRQWPPKKVNIFNAICQRERTGRRMTRTHTVDVTVPINNERYTRVPTPNGGHILIWADQEDQFFNGEADSQLREELEVIVMNRSPCDVSIEWPHRLREFPPHGFGEGPLLEPRSLEAVPRYAWRRAPNICDIRGLMPVHDTVAIAVRLLITAFGSEPMDCVL